jgi:hypothetical protein
MFEGDTMNNTKTLTKADLKTSVEDLHAAVMRRPGRVGQPELTYQDKFDLYEMRIQRSNIGYTVSCRLNDKHSHQLNGKFFVGSKPLGEIMLIAAAAPSDETIDTFFA